MIDQIYQFILELDKLKLIFRNTIVNHDRKESTAEHSWSATMIAFVLRDELKKEFGDFNELKTLKLTLIHDIVEIYAGDVSAFDVEARTKMAIIEKEALQKLMGIYPTFGHELHELWHEFEEKKSLEAQIAKAADAICPIFQRVQAKQSYGITVDNLESLKYAHFEFSKTFSSLYMKLKKDLIEGQLIKN